MNIYQSLKNLIHELISFERYSVKNICEDVRDVIIEERINNELKKQNFYYLLFDDRAEVVDIFDLTQSKYVCAENGRDLCLKLSLDDEAILLCLCFLQDTDVIRSYIVQHYGQTYPEHKQHKTQVIKMFKDLVTEDKMCKYMEIVINNTFVFTFGENGLYHIKVNDGKIQYLKYGTDSLMNQ